MRTSRRLRIPRTSDPLPMRSLIVACCLALPTAIPAHAFAQTITATAAPASADAREATQVVDAFMASLVGGDLEGARAQMSADAVVVANGQVFGLRDDYIGGPAKDDAAALRTVRRELLRRDVRTGIDVAWVVSEKRVRPSSALDGTGPSEVVIETMLLAKTAAGWKITHIHWSGRHG
jgi:ketosteroid isomerase-like protein